MEGWIKLHREIREHWIWEDENYLKAWLAILLSVNHKNKQVLIQRELIPCTFGQSLLNLSEWAKLFGKKWTIQRVRTFFKLLEDEQMITVEGLKKTTRVTVCNYVNYQIKQQTENKLTTDREQTENRQIYPNKNDKKEKKEKKEEGKRSLLEKNIIPPTLEMIKQFCLQRKNKVDPETFYNFYVSKGWMVGKTKMVDWHGCMYTWETRNGHTTTVPKEEEVTNDFGSPPWKVN